MTSERLFTPRFFWMCAFTFTVFLSLFQLIPTAPFHVRDLHRRVRRPQRTAANVDPRQPQSGRLHGDL